MKRGRAVLDFGSSGLTDASVTISDADITADISPHAWVLRQATADHTADEHAVEQLRVTVGDVAAGSFVIKGALDGPGYLTGTYCVGWRWDPVG